jgi:nucleoside-diphosphate-sugar epimerase
MAIHALDPSPAQQGPARAIVLGARGRFGLAAVQAFSRAGWQVLAQTRPGAVPPAAASHLPGVHWLGIDLADSAGIARAARAMGASADTEVVVHALNPSAYTLGAWRREVLPLAQAALAVLRQLHAGNPAARLLLPGNLYNYGEGAPIQLNEHTPMQASTVKGRLRTEMEALLERSGLPVAVIRAGDFWGSGSGSWFDLFVAKSLAKGQLQHPGHRHIATNWAYLPDLARAFVAVAQQAKRLPRFEQLQFAGRNLSGQDWLDTLQPIAQAQGWIAASEPLRWKPFPWWALRLAAPVAPLFRSLLEMRYLWNQPHSLDNRKLVACIGAEPATPLPVAARQALVDLGWIATPAGPDPVLPFTHGLDGVRHA